MDFIYQDENNKNKTMIKELEFKIYNFTREIENIQSIEKEEQNHDRKDEPNKKKVTIVKIDHEIRSF